MDKPSFVYTTYIKTTPERLWQALTEPAFTRPYWRATFDTDWKTGSTMTWHQFGVTIADPDQVVLEAVPWVGACWLEPYPTAPLSDPQAPRSDHFGARWRRCSSGPLAASRYPLCGAGRQRQQALAPMTTGLSSAIVMV